MTKKEQYEEIIGLMEMLDYIVPELKEAYRLLYELRSALNKADDKVAAVKKNESCDLYDALDCNLTYEMDNVRRAIETIVKG